MGRLASICASFLIVSAPFQAAFAQEQDERNVSVADRRHDEYEPLGMRLGGFDLNASVELGASHSDNLFGQEAGAENDDTFYDISPEARLTSHWSRHAVMAAAGASFNRYDSFKSEDANTHYERLGGRLDIGAHTAVTANLGNDHSVESRTDPSVQQSDQSDPIEYDIRSAGLGVTHQFVRLNLGADVTSTEYDYHDAAGASDQDLRDRTQNAVGLNAEYQVSPRLYVIGSARADKIEYDRTASQSENSDGLQLLAGVRVELNNLLQGRFSVGHFSRDYDTGRTIEGLALAGNVNWFVTPITTASFQASREARESSFVQPYVSTNFGGRIDHELLRNVILSGAASYGDDDYTDAGIDRQDDIKRYELGARYLMNRRVSFSAVYNRTDVDSSGAQRYRDFDENRIRLAVKFSL